MIQTLGIAVFALALVSPLILSWVGRGWISKYDSPPYSFDDIPDLSGKTALVTGTNTGIGYVTVRELARKGAHVVATTRSTAKGEETKERLQQDIGNRLAENVEFVDMELGSLKSVRKVASRLRDKGNNIDIAILNAGVMMCPFSLTEDGFESQIGTNHFGHFFLVKELLPVLTTSKARVVVVSSSAHMMPYSSGMRFDNFESDVDYDTMSAYGQSKLANILFSSELSRRYNHTGLTSNALHPGMIQTDLTRHVKSFFHDLHLDVIAKPILAVVNSAMMDAEMGALTQLYVATSPKLDGVTGKYFEPIAKIAKPTSAARSLQNQIKLWEMSETLIDRRRF